MKANLKKIISLVLVIVLTAAVAITGTLAYLTDRDSAVNVFAIGNVSIDLNEDFQQGATLVPGVDIEKKPTITNTGVNNAWVWATIAFPAALDNDDASKNVVHFNYTKESVAEGLWTWTDEQGQWLVQKGVVIDDVEYNVYTVLYQTVLKPGETTAEPVMTKVYMDHHVDIDPEGNVYHVENGVATDLGWNVNEQGAPCIYVSAYAIQAEGFDTVQAAYAAYQAQWGENGDEWFDGVYTKDINVIGEIFENGGNLYLLGSVSADDHTVAEDAVVNADLQDYTFAGIIMNNGELNVSNGNVEATYIENNGEVTFTDVEMKAGSPSDYACINLAGSVAEYNDVNLDSAGGGIAAVDGAQVVFNSGSVAVNTTNTSGRYNFYTQGAGSVITINGGEFSFSKTLNQKRAYVYAGAGTTVYINGGTFGPASTRSGYTAGILGEGTVIITGGTFGFNPSNWVADGYEAVQDGTTWTVVAK